MPYLYTILISMTPVSELRGAIPVALSLYRLPAVTAYLLAVLGNMIPIFFLLWFWKGTARLLMERSTFAKKWLTWIFERTKRRTAKKFEVWGSLALIFFVALPFPFTGAWTGSICAFLFSFPYWKAMGLIFIGVLIAGLVVTAASLGAFSLLF